MLDSCTHTPPHSDARLVLKSMVAGTWLAFAFLTTQLLTRTRPSHLEHTEGLGFPAMQPRCWRSWAAWHGGAERLQRWRRTYMRECLPKLACAQMSTMECMYAWAWACACVCTRPRCICTVREDQCHMRHQLQASSTTNGIVKA